MHEHVSRHPTGIPVDAFHGLATSSQQGPWYKERHYDVQVPPANSDASANQWGA